MERGEPEEELWLLPNGPRSCPGRPELPAGPEGRAASHGGSHGGQLTFTAGVGLEPDAGLGARKLPDCPRGDQALPRLLPAKDTQSGPDDFMEKGRSDSGHKIWATDRLPEWTLPATVRDTQIA